MTARGTRGIKNGAREWADFTERSQFLKEGDKWMYKDQGKTQ